MAAKAMHRTSSWRSNAAFLLSPSLLRMIMAHRAALVSLSLMDAVSLFLPLY